MLKLSCDLSAFCDFFLTKIIAEEEVFANSDAMRNTHYIPKDKYTEMMLLLGVDVC